MGVILFRKILQLASPASAKHEANQSSQMGCAALNFAVGALISLLASLRAKRSNPIKQNGLPRAGYASSRNDANYKRILYLPHERSEVTQIKILSIGVTCEDHRLRSNPKKTKWVATSWPCQLSRVTPI